MIKIINSINAKLKKEKSLRGGFTMVELLVAVALFTVVMLISVAVIFSIIAGNRKAQNINAVVNNLNFAIESMVRDMKTGYYYRCGRVDNFSQASFYTSPPTGLCTAGASTAQTDISFVSLLKPQPEAVRYIFVPGSAGVPGKIEKYTSAGAGASVTGSSLTSPDVDIKSAKFYVDSPAPGDRRQPSIFILISGTAKSGSTESDFIIQTYVSQRLLNIGF